MRSLLHQVVLITGAGSGVGAAAAEAFAAAGADVALLARGTEGLEVAAAAVRAQGRRALVLPADVTDAAAVADAVARCEAELGSLDVLVPNATTTVYGPFTDVAPEDFDRVVAVTFGGVVNVVRAALPALTRARGTIVATGSIASKVPLPGFSSYAAAKAAERQFLNGLRVELQADGVPVQVAQVHPGIIDTPLWDTSATTGGMLPRRFPEGYRPDVIASALVALARNPRPELTVGGEARLVEALWLHARPLGDVALRLGHRWLASGDVPARAKSGLHHPAGRGELRGAARTLGRGSLWTPLRLRLRLPRRSAR